MCEERYMPSKSKSDIVENESEEENLGTISRTTTFTNEFNTRLNKIVKLRGHLSGSEFIRVATIEKIEKEENIIVAQATWDLIGADILKKVMLENDIKISDIRESVRILTQQYMSIKKEKDMIIEGSELDIDNTDDDDFEV